MTKRTKDYHSDLLQLFHICRYGDFGEYSVSHLIWHLLIFFNSVETLI